MVPLFNERESLAELTERTQEAFKKTSYSIEYVFVDDGSTDGSFQELVSLRKKYALPMTIIRLRRRSGKSIALDEAFRHIRGDIVVTMDADLQDDPHEAVKLVKKVSEGYDLVVGWRNNRRDAQGKLHVSHVFNWAVSVFSGLKLHDMNCGLKAMTADVARDIRLYGQLHRFVPVLANVKGFTVTEMPVTHHARKYGASKFGFERILAAFDLITTLFLAGFGSRPLMVFGPVGLILIGLGGISLVYLSALHFMGESIGTRPLLLLGVLFVLFGLQLISTGLLGELITSISTKERRAPVAEILDYEHHA